jgi:hypothetical protein
VKAGQFILGKGSLTCSFDSDQISIVAGPCTIQFRTTLNVQLTDEQRTAGIVSACLRAFDDRFWETGKPTEALSGEILRDVIERERPSSVISDLRCIVLTANPAAESFRIGLPARLRSRDLV